MGVEVKGREESDLKSVGVGDWVVVSGSKRGWVRVEVKQG